MNNIIVGPINNKRSFEMFYKDDLNLIDIGFFHCCRVGKDYICNTTEKRKNVV